MSRKKLKMTPFARFLIVLILIAPLAYMGASYYNGQDGWQNLKNLVLNFQVGPQEMAQGDDQLSAEEVAQDEVMVNSQLARAQDELRFKDRRIDSLYYENTRLKQELKDVRSELEKVRRQLDQIRGAIGEE